MNAAAVDLYARCSPALGLALVLPATARFDLTYSRNIHSASEYMVSAFSFASDNSPM